jgi:hypothetical protein
MPILTSPALISALLAGIGGIVPSLLKIAAAIIADPMVALPPWHVIVPLAIYFVIGAILNAPLNKDRDISKAIMIGIAAPGIITNIASGYNTPLPPIVPAKSVPVTFYNHQNTEYAGIGIIGTASAATPHDSSEAPIKAYFQTYLGGQSVAIAPTLHVYAITAKSDVDVGQLASGANSYLNLPFGTTGVRVTDGSITGAANIPVVDAGNPVLAIVVVVHVRPTAGISWLFGAPQSQSAVGIDVTFRGNPLSQCPNISGKWTNSDTSDYPTIISQNGCFISSEYTSKPNLHNYTSGFAVIGAFNYTIRTLNSSNCSVIFFGKITDLSPDGASPNKYVSEKSGSSGDCGYSTTVTARAVRQRNSS